MCHYNKEAKVQETFPRSEEIVVIDNPSNMHKFNRFEEKEDQAQSNKCHFVLIDLTGDNLYDVDVPAIEG